MSTLQLLNIITIAMFIFGNFGNFSIVLKKEGNEILHRGFWIVWWLLIGLMCYMYGYPIDSY